MNGIELSKLSDTELVDLHGHIGDPDFREMVLSEERRRAVDKSVVQARRANWIAIGALAVSILSLVVALYAS